MTLSMFISTVHSKANPKILTASGRRTKMRALMKRRGFPGGSAVNAMLETQVRKISSRRKWQPTPIFLQKISHGRRSLAAVHGVAESDITEAT